MSYSAIVCRIVNVRKHPNADRLAIGSALGYTVIVGLDQLEGELGIFFGPDGRLSEEFARQNDLIAYKDLVTNEKKGGFFQLPHLRIHVQKFRQIASEGFWIPLNSVAYTGVDAKKLTEGCEFTVLNGHRICAKYYTPATEKALKQGNQKEEQPGWTPYFRQNFDTPHFRNVVQSIPHKSLIWITEKLHGTSHRVGYVRHSVPLSWWKRIVNRYVSAFSKKYEYVSLHGSRKIILSQSPTQLFRYQAVGDVQLRKGECLFGEVVGWNREKLIQPAHGCLPNLQAQYGERIAYTYGAKQGEAKFFVYRITQTNDDGETVELPWLSLVHRCKELQLNPVPCIGYVHIYDGNVETLQSMVDDAAIGPSVLDASHIREGVVLRVESDEGIRFCKRKSFDFLELEGKMKDNPNFVDTEEIV